MVVSPEDVAPSPGGESAVSSKRGASPDAGSVAGGDAEARKKKKIGPGSRGVANLTPEQLAKKRENDREAQRNIRKRTKDQIENLERQIQELTSQQPYQEFLAMKRAKEAVEKENAEIKHRLSSIIGDMQALVSSSDTGRAYASPTQSYQSAPNSSMPAAATLSGQNTSTPGSVASPGSMELPAPQHWQSQSGAGSVQPSEHARVQLNHQRHEMRHGLDMGPERLGLGFLLDPQQRVNRISNGANGAQDTPRYHHVPMKHDWTDARNDSAIRSHPSASSHVQGRETSAGLEGIRSRIRNGGPGYMSQPEVPPPHFPHDSGTEPRWATLPKNCESTCPLDSLLLDLFYERRQRAAEGMPTQEVVGPRYPSVSSLLNPSHRAYSHPLSKVFTDILNTFPDISTLPERVAVLFIMFLVMRWKISPTKENYERLPEWMRPLDCQINHPHPAWMDNLPFIGMREKLVREYKPNGFPFDNFFIPYTTTLSLNWPYEDTDALLQGLDGDELMVNPVFERHIRNADNWSLGEAFAKAFPELAEHSNIKPKKSKQRQ